MSTRSPVGAAKDRTASGRDDRKRWLALLLVCAAQLMLVLDGTIVNATLPAIEDDLGFSRASPSWVANPYGLKQKSPIWALVSSAMSYAVPTSFGPICITG